MLDELKVTLTGDARNCVQRLSESKEIHEELGVLVGIANAMAERIVDAADDARKLCAKTEQQVAASKPKARSRTSRPSKNDNVVDAAGDASELRAKTEKAVAGSKPKARSRTSRPSKNDNVVDAEGDASELRAKTEKPIAAGKPKARSRTSGPRKNGNDARKTKTVAKTETAKVLTV
nr:hypothetical protein [Sphingorhabdus sp. M41]